MTDTNKMRDGSREQFEAWVKSKWPETDLGQFNDGEYCGFTLQHCWSAWQASRQAVVVVLPSLQSVDPFAYHQHGNARVEGHNQCREETRVAIEAQGLRVGVLK